MKFSIKERIAFNVNLETSSEGRQRAISFIRKGIRLHQLENEESKQIDLKWYTLRNLDKECYLLFCAYNERKELLGACSASSSNHGIMWLDWLIVDEKYRRQGIASSIIKFIVSNYALKNKVHKLQCDSLIANKASRKLLRKQGFRKVGKMKRHWGKQDYYLWEYLV